MADRLTGQQQQAVSCRGSSVVLSSGAGCGKTHVLTRRYLSHLRDDDVEVGQVVAITFTDRAARQMRERIRTAVLDHVRAAATDAESDRWTRHLRGLESAPISTIHAFCGNLLRQHAVEAGLDPGFEVLEDVLSVNFEAEALIRCLQDLLTDSRQAGEDLRQLVLLYGWKPVVEAVQDLLRSRDASGWQGWLGQAPSQVAHEWKRLARAEVLPQYLSWAASALPKISRCLRLLRERPPKSGTRMAESARFVLDLLPRLAEAPDLGDAVRQIVDAAKVGKERAEAWSSPAAYDEAKDVLEGFRKELKELQLDTFAAPREEAEEAAAVGQRFLRVAQAAVHAYGALKRQKSVLDFQDLLIMARDLLRDQASVRERLRRRYRFVLIDELQDTDPVQMELVRHVCGEGTTRGKLFAVGDHAQSIYRFRGADVSLFQGLRAEVPTAGRLGLTVNFRSQPAILHFANALFRDHLQAYEPLTAHLPQTNPGSCTEFLWSPWSPAENVTEGRAREAEWIARRIAAMVAGEPLVVDRARGGDRLRPVRPGDVVLLFRAMSNVALYEAALREQGLDYYLVGGRAFFAQQEIYDILNLLRCLENPQDAVSLAGTLRSPFCCLSDEALFLLSRHERGLWSGLQDDGSVARLPEGEKETALRARRNIRRWRSLKDRLPIARLLGEVFAGSGFDAATQFEYLGDRKLANLWKLVDLGRAFDRSNHFGLPDFIARLGDLVRTQPREEQAATQPENADVVRLMSIHQAKGLEFPVVFVPDLAARGGGSRRPVASWDPRLGCIARPPVEEDKPLFTEFPARLQQVQEEIEEWHEALRILYVACTRAQDYLVLSAAMREPFVPSNPWTNVLAERFDLRSGQFRAALKDGPVPVIRVVTELAAAGGIDLPNPAPGRKPHHGTPDRIPPDAACSVPPRLSARRVFTLGELDSIRRRPGSLFAESDWTAEDFAVQFDAEDASADRSWSGPGEPGDGAPDKPHDHVDSLVRSVLSRWDYRDPHGWKACLDEICHGGRATPACASILDRVAQSEIRGKLASARKRMCDFEFLVPVPGHPAKAIRGTIDRLWQDARGRWHLLAFAPCGQPVESAEDLAGYRFRLAVQSWAVRQRFGSWPSSATVHSLASGKTIRWTAARLALEDVERVIVQAVNVIAGLALPPGEGRWPHSAPSGAPGP